MSYKFTTIINQEGRWFVARCVELGVVSQGRNVEESQKNLKEAVELYLEDYPKSKRYFSARAPIVTSLEINHA